jgi:glycerol-3-phosphate dehydrogenase
MQEIYDLAIIGGGINGAGIARDASQRGLKVILFEKHDFAFGASSKSSKLAHGGLRYLQYFNFGLVQESLAERSTLQKIAPHLVKMARFIFPIYPHTPSKWLVQLGLNVYDFLSPSSVAKHQNLTPEEVQNLFPQIQDIGLSGGCLFSDAIMQDSRLVLENILTAQAQGAEALNYTPVTSIEKIDKQLFKVYSRDQFALAKCIVNATGAWSPEVQKLDPAYEKLELAPSKGIHLVIPLINPIYPLILIAPQDRRILFLIPWNGYSLLGTTDSPFTGNPDKVEVSQQEIDYLLIAFNAYFPKITVKPFSAFAGVRPLLKEDYKSTSATSREHRLLQSSTGIFHLLGGKYTAYRLMAEQTVDAVCKQLGLTIPCQTAQVPLDGAASFQDPNLQGILSPQQWERLKLFYGNRSLKIWEIVCNSPEQAGLISPERPEIFAELTYAVHFEMAKTVEDWLYRRTAAGYGECSKDFLNSGGAKQVML